MIRPLVYCMGLCLVVCLTATLAGEPEAQVRKSADAVAAVQKLQEDLDPLVAETAAPGVSRAEQEKLAGRQQRQIADAVAELRTKSVTLVARVVEVRAAAEAADEDKGFRAVLEVEITPPARVSAAWGRLAGAIARAYDERIDAARHAHASATTLGALEEEKARALQRARSGQRRPSVEFAIVGSRKDFAGFERGQTRRLPVTLEAIETVAADWHNPYPPASCHYVGHFVCQGAVAPNGQP